MNRPFKSSPSGYVAELLQLDRQEAYRALPRAAFLIVLLGWMTMGLSQMIWG